MIEQKGGTGWNKVEQNRTDKSASWSEKEVDGPCGSWQDANTRDGHRR